MIFDEPARSRKTRLQRLRRSRKSQNKVSTSTYGRRNEHVVLDVLNTKLSWKHIQKQSTSIVYWSKIAHTVNGHDDIDTTDDNPAGIIPNHIPDTNIVTENAGDRLENEHVYVEPETDPSRGNEIIDSEVDDPVPYISHTAAIPVEDVLEAVTRLYESTGLSELPLNPSPEQICEILPDPVTNDVIEQCVNSYQDCMQENKLQIRACASCGYRKLQGAGDTDFALANNILPFKCDDLQLGIPLNDHLYSNYIDDSEMVYNLHKTLVLDDGTFYLCKNCKVSRNGARKEYRYSLSAGFDLRLTPAALPKLTDMEQILISLGHPFQTVIQLQFTPGNDSALSMKMKSNIISFPMNGAQTFTSILPHLTFGLRVHCVVLGAVKDVQTYLSSSTRCDEYMKHLSVRPHAVYAWLLLLRAHNKRYANINIIPIEQTSEILEKMIDNLIRETAVVCDPKANMAFAASTSNVAMQSVGDMQYALYSGAQSEENATAITLRNIAGIGRYRPDFTPDGGNPTISIGPDSVPYNDYTSTDNMLHNCFPYLLLTGNELNAKSRLPNQLTDHLLHYYYDDRFSTNISLIFLLADQNRLHECAANVCVAFSTHADKIAKITGLINQPNFDTELRTAINNPDSADAKAIVRKFSSLIRIVNRNTSLSRARSSMFPNRTYAQHYFFGPSSYFVTISPEICNDRLLVKIGHVLQNIEELVTSQINIPYWNKTKRISYLCANPVVAADLYQRIMVKFQKVLLQHPYSSRYTKRAQDHNLGLAGRIRSIIRRDECQNRGTLHGHFHFWTDLSPLVLEQALKKAAGDGLSQYLTQVIDSHFCVTIHNHPDAIPRSMHTSERRHDDTDPMVFDDQTPPSTFIRPIDCDPMEILEDFPPSPQHTPRNCNTPTHNISLPPTSTHTNTQSDSQSPNAHHYNVHGDDEYVAFEPSSIGAHPRLYYNADQPWEFMHTAHSYALRTQNHKHSFTCAKGDAGKIVCRMNKPEAVKDTTEFMEVFLDNDSGARNIVFGQHAEQDPSSRICLPLTIENILKIGDDRFIKLELARKTKQDMHITDSNPYIMATLRCNQAWYILGSATEAINAYYYSSKYICKTDDPLENVLQIVNKAYHHVNKYPTTHTDSRTDPHTKFFLQRILNKLNTMNHISAQEAVQYLLQRSDYYSSTKHGVYISPWATYNYLMGTHASGDEYDDQDTSEHDDSPVVHTAGVLFYTVRRHDTDMDIDDDTEPSSIKIPIAAVTHYRYRPVEFKDVTQYEFTSLVTLCPMTEKHRELLAGIHIPQSRGRLSNKIYQFQVQHPLYGSYILRLNSKFCAPQLAGAPPPVLSLHSYTDDSSDCPRYLRYARFILAIFCPWDIYTGRPAYTFDVPGLNAYLAFLQFPGLVNTPRSNTILAWISTIGRGSAASSHNRKLLNLYRRRALVRWTKQQKMSYDSMQTNTYKGGLQQSNSTDNESLISDLLQHISESSANPTEQDIAADFDINSTYQCFQSTMDQIKSSAGRMRMHIPIIVTIPSPDDCQTAIHNIPDYSLNNADSAVAESNATCFSQIVPSPELQALYAYYSNEDFIRIDERLDTRQAEIVSKLLTFIQAKELQELHTILRPDEQNPHSCPVQQFLWIQGSAGSGKTFTMNTIQNSLPNTHVIRFTSFTGVASILLPHGETFQRLFNMPWASTYTKLDVSTRQNLRLKLGRMRVLVIDEVSMLTCTQLYFIHLRLQEIYEQPGSPFGGVSVVLMGDLKQLPQPNKSGLPSVMLKCSFTRTGTTNELQGKELLQMFMVYEYTIQHRTTDQQHLTFLRQFTSQQSLDHRSFAHIPIYDPSNVIHDPEKWLKSPYACISNKERRVMNDIRSQLLSKASGFPLLKFKRHITRQSSMTTPPQGEPTDTSADDAMHSQFPELYQYFTKG